MKINKFLLGFGLGGLIATYICEFLYAKERSEITRYLLKNVYEKDDMWTEENLREDDLK